MVGLDRIELSTSPLSGVRSSHLSYRPSRCSPARGDDSSASARRSMMATDDAEAYPIKLGSKLGIECTEEVTLESGFLSERYSLERR